MSEAQALSRNGGAPAARFRMPYAAAPRSSAAPWPPPPGVPAEARLRGRICSSREEGARAVYEAEDALGAVTDAQAALANSPGIPPTALRRVV